MPFLSCRGGDFVNHDAAMILECVFGRIWLLFTRWHIPGTNVSPGAWALFSLVLVTGVRFLKRLAGGDLNENM